MNDHINEFLPESVKKELANRLNELKTSQESNNKPLNGLPAVMRLEIPLDSNSIDPLEWLSFQTNNTKIYFAGRNDIDIECAGVGIAAELNSNASSDESNKWEFIEEMKNFLRDDLPNLRFYGGIAFPGDSIDDDWKSFGNAKFIIPKFEILRNGPSTLLACNFCLKNEELNENKTGKPYTNDLDLSRKIDNILVELDQLNFNMTSPSPFQPPLHSHSIISRHNSPTFDSWKKNINSAVNDIRNESYKKIVLARKSTLKFNTPLNATEILLSLKKMLNAKRYDFLFQWDEETTFVGSSPERLYKRSGQSIESEAVAGTRPRGSDLQDDLQLEKDLLNSNKDQREHDFVANSLKHDLDNYCTSLNVDTEKSLLKLKEGQHLLLKFKGHLKNNVTDSQLLEILHPTPAVGGFPTKTTLPVISMVETFKRGWYAGAIGWIGCDSSDFAVGIRSALVKKDSLSLFAGVGIVDGSDPESEWNEVDTKMSNFMNVISQ